MIGEVQKWPGSPKKILGKVWMIFEQNLKNFEFCALCRCAMAYFTWLWPILHISFKSSRKYTGIEKNCKNLLSKIFQKLGKKSFWGLQRFQGVPKSFWERFGGFLNRFPKILFFIPFLGTLRAAFYTAKSEKLPILPYFWPILHYCSPKSCAQSTKKLRKIQNFLDFVQKSSKL